MKKSSQLLEDLQGIIQKLRGPEGCPWDRKQTPRDVKTYLTEELYELLEAIDSENPRELAEETGDILFMILFLTNLYEEKNRFSLAEALESAKKKMIHRHPHVFGSVQVSTADEVMTNWHKLKEKEGKRPKTSHLDGIPGNLPALSRACRLTAKAAEVGFDWEDARGVLTKIAEETSELAGAIDRGKIDEASDEIGDLLFCLVNLSRHLGVDPEQALRRTNEKFTARFHHIEQGLKKRGTSLKEAPLSEMDELWEEAKGREGSPGKTRCPTVKAR